MKTSIDVKHLILLIPVFILFTVIGTISHEYGHIIIAKILGYETTLYYGSMTYDKSDLNEKLSNIYNENKTEIENGTVFDQKEEYEKGLYKLESNALLVTIGGPLQTILTGTFGLLILFFQRKKHGYNILKLIDWVGVFLALFWTREVFNLVVGIGTNILFSKGSYFGGDEMFISVLLDLWPGTFSTILGVIGLGISVFVVFKVIPSQLRLSFILTGLIGGVTGFILWMNVLGPIVLPY